MLLLTFSSLLIESYKRDEYIIRTCVQYKEPDNILYMTQCVLEKGANGFLSFVLFGLFSFFFVFFQFERYWWWYNEPPATDYSVLFACFLICWAVILIAKKTPTHLIKSEAFFITIRSFSVCIQFSLNRYYINKKNFGEWSSVVDERNNQRNHRAQVTAEKRLSLSHRHVHHHSKRIYR